MFLEPSPLLVTIIVNVVYVNAQFSGQTGPEHHIFPVEFCFSPDREFSNNLTTCKGTNWPLDIIESRGMYNKVVCGARCRNFTPHSVWRRSARPCGVGVAPWSELLYVCGADSRSVLVVERAQPRAVARLAADDMLCPVHIAFLKNLGEIYVTGDITS